MRGEGHVDGREGLQEADWQLGHLRVLPCQDPDLEAKRKAELAKIKQKNRRFKDKVEQVLQRQKARGAGRRGRPPRAPPGAQSAPAPSQGPS